MKTLLTVAVLVAAAALPATASTAVAAPCGVTQTPKDTWFTNCGTDNVVIIVGTDHGQNRYCLPPGMTHLGSTEEINGIAYLGRGCSPVVLP